MVKWEEVNSEARLRRKDVGMDFALRIRLQFLGIRAKHFVVLEIPDRLF